MNEQAIGELWDWVRAAEFDFAEKRPKILRLFGERGPSAAVWHRYRAAKEIRAILERRTA